MKLRLLLHDIIQLDEAISENWLYRCRCMKGKAFPFMPKEIKEYKAYITAQLKKNLRRDEAPRFPIVAHYYIFTDKDKDVTNYVKALEDAVFEALERNDRDVVQNTVTKVHLPEGAEQDEIHMYLFDLVEK